MPAAGVHGYLLRDSSVEHLADAMRQVVRGGIVVPPDLAAAAVWGNGADPLTQRERDALRLADEGLSNKEIAIRLALRRGRCATTCRREPRNWAPRTGSRRAGSRG